jgi:nitrous oxidase accessory protein
VGGSDERMKLLLFISSIVLSLTVAGKTLRVGKNESFTTIQQAVNAAQRYDTILVEAGTYHEKNLVINKPVVLIGINYPVIDGDKKYEVISIKAGNTVIQGFKVIRSGNSEMDDMAGIKIINSYNVVIRNNILDDNCFGIYSQYGVNCTIENNKITSYGTHELQSGNGIHCWKSDSMRIIGNTITGHRDGIYFEFVNNSVIWRNTSEKNIRYGLHFMFSNNDAYICNIFKANISGVAVMFSKGIKMYNNYFEENWGDAAYGILLKEISDGFIEGNHFVKNTTGIFIEGGSRIQMHKNIFESNGWGMKIQASCMDIAVNNNNFINNTFDIGTNGSLMLNNFDGNYWDKYDGYDINKDHIGDIPYRPVSMYSMIIEKNPPAMILFRSFITSLLDKTEKVLPVLTPENLKDNYPLMKKIRL